MRYIALLEFQPGLVAQIMPPSSYLERTNGTLAQENTLLRIDAQGFMVSEQPQLPGDHSILLLGGSSLENLYVHHDQRVLAVMEQQLANAGQRSKVYNAGISNAHLLHLVNLMTNKGLALRPGYVVYFPAAGADADANELEHTFWNADGNMSPVRELKVTRPPVPVPAFHDRNHYDDQRRLLRVLYAICRNFDIELLVGTWPVYGPLDAFMASQEPDPAYFAANDVQMQALNQVIREVCAEQGGSLIDFEQAMAPLHRPDYFYDRNHPNARGCALIASLSVQALLPHLERLPHAHS